MDARLKQGLLKSANAFRRVTPVLIGVVLLLSLANTLIPKTAYTTFFGQGQVLNSLIGSSLGSVLVGNPITSYIIGGELLENGVGLVAVTAFIVAWVTVGVVQLPAEAVLLGKRFAITRNLISFLFTIIVALVTVAILGVL